MNKAKETSALESLFKDIPDFRSYWLSEKQYYSDEFDNTTHCGDMSILTHYVYDDITENKKSIDLPILFERIEEFITSGSEDLQTAACTCFLESLQNMELPSKYWVHLLGQNSKKYCQSWDDFTGVKTTGL